MSYKKFGAADQKVGLSLERCYKTHKPLPLGGGLVIYGGNAEAPKITDADIYVSVQHNIMYSKAMFPWNPGEAFTFYIPDGGVPTNVREFKKLIEYLAENIKAGKKIHVGCIGGHGRTGMVFAALVVEMLGDLDAITYVRKNYCKKAVETTKQVEFLNKLYGIKKVAGSHPVSYYGKTDWYGSGTASTASKNYGSTSYKKDKRVVNPLTNSIGTVWSDE